MAYEKILEALIISLNVSIFSTLISLLVSLPLGAIIAIKIFYGRSILIACIHALTSSYLFHQGI